MKTVKRKSKNGVVKAALKLLSDETHWAQGGSAFNDENVYVDIDSPTAVKWCASGALYRCAENDEVGRKAYDCVNSIARKEFNLGIISVNDLKGYDAVITVLTKAAKVCK